MLPLPLPLFSTFITTSHSWISLSKFSFLFREFQCVYPEIGDVQWAGVTQLRFVCFYFCNKTNILGKVIETQITIDFWLDHVSNELLESSSNFMQFLRIRTFQCSHFIDKTNIDRNSIAIVMYQKQLIQCMVLIDTCKIWSRIRLKWCR